MSILLNPQMNLINLFKFTNVAFWLIILIIDYVNCKGTGVISASGGASGDVCIDCGTNYTDEELKVALIVLCLILSVFLLILCCQCSSRIVNECERQKRLRNKNSEIPENGSSSSVYSRRMHSCDHSFYGTNSTRANLSQTNYQNNRQKNLNYSLSQLDKNPVELNKHCSISSIACGTAQCATAITSPDLKHKSSFFEYHPHQLNHHHLPQSYHHLNNLDHSIDNIYKYNLDRENGGNKFKYLKRSATLAECNLPIELTNEQYLDKHYNKRFDHDQHNLTNGIGTHLHSMDINQNYQKMKMNAQLISNKKLTNLNKLNTNSASTGKLNNYNTSNNSTPKTTNKQNKLNASSLATVLKAQQKFVKLKNFARSNQNFKSLPAPKYIRSNINVNINPTTEYI